MKIWKKATALLLLVCMILPLAVSCSGKEDANQLVLFSAKGKRNYTVIRPENGSDRIVDAADQIADTLKEKLGITVSVTPDGEQTDEKDASDALWKSHVAKGITGIMTNRASKFVGLYQKD